MKLMDKLNQILDSIYNVRFFLGLGALLGLLMAVGIYGIDKVGMINKRVNNIYTQELIPLETIEDIKASMYRIRERVGRHITEPKRQNIHETKIREQLSRLARNKYKYEQSRLDSNEIELVSSLESHWQKYLSIIEEQVLPLSRKGKIEQAEDVLYGVALKEFRAARISLNRLSDYQLQRAENRQDNAHNAYMSILQLTAAIILFSMLVGFFVVVRYKQTHHDKKLGDLILNHNNQGVMITDKQLRITWVNSAFEKITGYTFNDIKGKSPAILSSGRQSPAFYKSMWVSIKKNGLWEGEIWNKHKDGEVYPEWLNIVALKNKRGDIDRYAGTFIDLSQSKKAEEKIHQLAYYDPLTKLGNRYLLNEQLEKMLTVATANNHQLGVLLIDINHFKEINTSLGRQVGDDLLKCMAQLLQNNISKEGLVTRHDGDRFIVLLPVSHSSFKKIKTELTEFTLNIKDNLLSSLQCPDHEVRVNCSIGISCFPKDANDSNNLLKYASIALENSKKTQRNSFQFYAISMSEESNHRYQLSIGISKAVERNELFLVYQPQVDSHGMVAGAETLIRWKSQEFGIVPPDVFIPIAEETGDILEIGNWVFKQSLQKIKLWKNQGLFESGHFKRLAINVSIHQILSDNSYGQFIALCESEGISAESIELEITETGIMSFSEHVIKRLNRLREYGFSLAVDDFGTGQSSLSRLNQFPVNILKIDRSFTQQILTDKTQAAIVNYIINLAHTLNMEVIVEGVEELSEVNMLMQFGCDVIQGYYFSKPLSDKDFEDYIKNKTSESLFKAVKFSA